GPALDPFARDEGRGRRMVPSLAESDRMKRPIELAVAAAVEAKALGLARAGRDRGDAGQHGEGVDRAEAMDVADLADELGGDEDAAALEADERVIADEVGQSSLERGRLGNQPLELAKPIAGQLGVDAWDASQQPGSGSSVSGGDEVGGPGLVTRDEPDEVG